MDRYDYVANRVLQVDQFPMPRPNDLFATLAGGQKFSKLDLSHAYQQVVLEPDSHAYLTINTCITIPLYAASIWSGLGPCHFSADHGTGVARFFRCGRL